MKDENLINDDYKIFVADLKVRIRSARISAARAVNRDLILLYWDIGRAIVEKQAELGWGRAVVERLVADLQAAFPGTKGFSAQNLWRMRQFYADYTTPAFFEHARGIAGLADGQSQSSNAPEVLSLAVRDLVAQIPWGHHANLLAKIKAPESRVYYLRATVRYGWTRNVLLNQIKAAAFERSLKEGKAHNFSLALPERLAEQAEEALKSSYNLEFLGIDREVREREKARAADDQPSIGIILCAEKDDVVVEFSLKSKTNPIGVAEYQLTDRLPKELRGKLRSEKALKDVLLMKSPAKG